MKTCITCGTTHTHIPPDAKLDKAGAWWQCTCDSTMFVMNESTAGELLKKLIIEESIKLVQATKSYTKNKGETE